MPTFSMTIQREYLNLLKWLALIAMVAFHFSKAFSYNQPEYLVLLGRMAFPIFGFVLGYCLSNSCGVAAKALILNISPNAIKDCFTNELRMMISLIVM